MIKLLLKFIAVCLICSCTSIKQNSSYPVISGHYPHKTGVNAGNLFTQFSKHFKSETSKTQTVVRAENARAFPDNIASIPVTVRAFGIHGINNPENSLALRNSMDQKNKMLLPGLSFAGKNKQPHNILCSRQQPASKMIMSGSVLKNKLRNNPFLMNPLPESQSRGSSGFGIASFVLGLVGFFAIFFGGFGITLLFGLLAVIFGAIGFGRQSRGYATAGFILGIIDLLISFILILAFLAFFSLIL